jgi:EAL and modified HD-GYP domain-containing signal transduction protein
MSRIDEAVAEVFVGRQPILDGRQRLVGYELLFRSGTANEARVASPDEATASVVSRSLTEIGLERLVGRHAAWINVSREFALSGLVETMPARNTVIEILEDQTIDGELVAATRALKRQGYRIALDDFTYQRSAGPLLSVADVVKLDVRALGRDGVREQATLLRPFGVTLLAEKVETREEHAFCSQAGCELFQGYFFCRPEVVSDRNVAARRLPLLQFISRLQDPTVEFGELQRMIARDVALSYRLLRYVNSAFFGLRREVSSVNQALVLLGMENLRRWATLTLFTSVDGKPQELTVTALLRARFCELAGAGIRATTAEELFTLGLFSVVDALTDTPMAEVVRATPFPQSMRDALVCEQGEAGRLLECARLIEAGDRWAAQRLVPDAARLYLDAVIWAQEAAAPLFDEPAARAA